MTGLSNLNKRVSYYGKTSEDRMNRDKLYSLKKSLFDAYQAETAVLEDNREFKCLINPNKNTTDYDNKILSIPFEDVCLNSSEDKGKTSQGAEKIGIKVGEVFTWKETNTHWLVYLRYLEESAYFRAQIRKCNNQVEINGKSYWVYLRGPTETSITWNQKDSIEWNDLNYSLVMYITQDENTLEYFHRFSKVKISTVDNNKKETWQVVGQNPYFGNGIIEVMLEEFYENTVEDEAEVEKIEKEASKEDKTDYSKPYIKGSAVARLYDIVDFEAVGFTDEDCSWYFIKDNKTSLLEEKTDKISLEIIRKGNFSIKYKGSTQESILDVKVESF
jgi:hypothetical protein